MPHCIPGHAFRYARACGLSRWGWGSTRFRLGPPRVQHALPWGVRVVSQTKSKKRTHPKNITAPCGEQACLPSTRSTSGQQGRAVLCFGWGVFIDFVGSPHVPRAQMGARVRGGGPNEIEVTAPSRLILLCRPAITGASSTVRVLSRSIPPCRPSHDRGHGS